MKRALGSFTTLLALALLVAALLSSSGISTPVVAQPSPPGTNANPVFVQDVDNPARQPFAARVCTFVGTLRCNTFEPQTFTVPSRVRTVIEQISGTCASDGQTSVNLVLSTVVGTVHVDTTLPLAFNAGGGPIQFIVVPPTLTRIYPDPGTSVTFQFNGTVTSGPGDFVCRGSVIGHHERL
jgi:hypothetical protein